MKAGERSEGGRSVVGRFEGGWLAANLNCRRPTGGYGSRGDNNLERVVGGKRCCRKKTRME